MYIYNYSTYSCIYMYMYVRNDIDKGLCSLMLFCISRRCLSFYQCCLQDVFCVCVCVCVCVSYFATFSVFHYIPNRA